MSASHAKILPRKFPAYMPSCLRVDRSNLSNFYVLSLRPGQPDSVPVRTKLRGLATVKADDVRGLAYCHSVSSQHSDLAAASSLLPSQPSLLFLSRTGTNKFFFVET